ncbi:hypothetical protein I5677_14220 [Mobilitalea sibirica]|uniref:O-antigen ligase-like membrane protein n=1 Tax=Mobilitalea sibirica TaxID=1462919 RepID=A0A8J7L386_9FIRM|nr:hypothetical protein [Mobilitalea sibirica]MBH1942053.1 hypothetical protein [Mobilitalea sibirica]
MIKSKLSNFFKSIKRDNLLHIIFQILIFSSFWGSKCFPITVPGIGELYLFRISLILFVCFYIYYNIKNKHNPFVGRTKIEYAVFSLAIIMILYGFISLFRAIDFVYTFRRLFNLSFNIIFLIVIILFIDSKQKVKFTIINCFVNFILLQLLGVYEIFNGGIFYDYYNNYKRFVLFNKAYQHPLVSFSNTNDFSSMLIFCLPILVLALVLTINKTNERKSKIIYSIILVFIISLTYFLIKAAGARLIYVSFAILLIGLAFYIVFYNRKLIHTLGTIVLCLFFVIVLENYTTISINIKNYINTVKYEAEIKKINKNTNLSESNTNDTNKDNINEIEKPVILNPPSVVKVPLKDQFFTSDEESGELKLNITASGGVRVALIIFAMDSFIDSKGMGVGLGNTELMAKEVSAEKFGGLWSIHSFPARIIADMGVFVIIPAVFVIWLIFKEIFNLIRKYRKSNFHITVVIFTLIIILGFPFVSTSSSDAQDILSMWLSIAAIILLLTKIPELYSTDEIEIN